MGSSCPSGEIRIAFVVWAIASTAAEDRDAILLRWWRQLAEDGNNSAAEDGSDMADAVLPRMVI
jgi:hypothetical protein